MAHGSSPTFACIRPSTTFALEVELEHKGGHCKRSRSAWYLNERPVGVLGDM